MFVGIKIGMAFMDGNWAIYRRIIIMNNLGVTVLPLLNIILRREQRLNKNNFKRVISISAFLLCYTCRNNLNVYN